MKRSLLAILLMAAIVIIFWGRLFFPEPKLVYTVEIIGSDIWNVYYPIRHFLSESLKAGQLPFWSKDLGLGLPVMAEGQIGVFYLPNLVLYRLFPTWMAWNLSIILTFFLGFLGSYLFFKKLGISSWASLTAAFSFSFGGYFVARVIHMAPLQTASLLPWVFLSGEYLWEKPTKWRALLFAFVFSQQIFAGHMQWVILTLVGLVIFSSYHLFEKGRLGKAKLAVVLGALVLGFALAAPQILQTIELRSRSGRSAGLSQEEVFVFPYNVRNLITFVFPEYHGTPRNGTYSADPSLGLFWENTAYMGILPLVFLLVTLVARNKRPWEWALIFLGVVSLLLALGRSSPLYFVHTLPVFNNFRVSSRFLLLTTLAVAGLAGSGIDRVFNQISGKRLGILARAFPVLVLLLAIGDLGRFVWSYHALVPVQEALASPETSEYIRPGERIYTDLDYLSIWKKAYLEKGWQESAPFLYLRNSLYGNVSFIFGRSNIRPLAGLATRRQELYEKNSLQMLDASSVEYVISPSRLEDDDLELVKTIESQQEDLPPLFVYKNLDSLERMRFVSSYVVRTSLDEAVLVVEAGNFPFASTVVLEKEPGGEFEELREAEITVVADEDQHLVMRTTTDGRAILVVSDSYYPAWEARIDGVETEIIPVNINQRAIVVPAGEHEVEMLYVPRMFYRGLWVSLGSLVVFILVVILKPQRFFRKT